MKNRPQRMCVSCREAHEKQELIRVVKNKDGEVFIDDTGRSNGRGAYICANKECIEKARKGRMLERALKGPVGSEIYDRLMDAVD